MRIIAGSLKGRRFTPPAKTWPTRPTTDYAKEGLFNVLTNILDFESTKMLDLFGGTGSHCYEFISRGCTSCHYVDKHGPCVQFVKKQVEVFNIEKYITIIRSDVFKYVENCKLKFDFIFAGPPYPLPNLDDIPEHIFNHDILNSSGLLVLEHNPNHDFKHLPFFETERKYGTTIFSFFRKG